jgi:hypothetical protein
VFRAVCALLLQDLANISSASRALPHRMIGVCMALCSVYVIGYGSRFTGGGYQGVRKTRCIDVNVTKQILH